MLSNTGSLAQQQYNPRELEGGKRAIGAFGIRVFFSREYYMRGVVVRERLFCRTAQSVCVLAVCARTALHAKNVKSRYDGTVRPLAEKTSG